MIHHTALIGEPPQMHEWHLGVEVWTLIIGRHVTIGAYTCVDGGYDDHTRIGDNSWLMKQVHVAHDCQIGERVTIASGSILGGYVHVGDDTKIGLGVVVLPYRRIGKNCQIGAGSVVTQNVPDGETWAGNPARPLTAAERDPRPFSERDPYLEQYEHAREARA